MRLLFPIFRYFPHGGLQRDMLQIAEETLRRGHKVTIVTMAWQGGEAPPTGIELKLFPPRGLSHHSQAKHFANAIGAFAASGKFDRIVGFNRMPGLDLYFAADSCFAKNAASRHAKWVLTLPRYRVFLALEQAVFAPEAKTRILCLTERQKQEFIAFYGTPEERFRLLPPGISPMYRRPENAGEVRAAKRAELGVSPGEKLLLEVGSGFRTKGVDRTLRALAALPEELRQTTKLFVAGRDSSCKFESLARHLKLASRVNFGGGRDDVASLMLAADLLVHPARNEAAGNVLLEAIAAGTPVFCTANCGFGSYVAEAGGEVLPEPFDETAFSTQLAKLLSTPGRLEVMREQAIAYGKKADFYRRPQAAAEAIEEAAYGAIH